MFPSLSSLSYRYLHLPPDFIFVWEFHPLRCCQPGGRASTGQICPTGRREQCTHGTTGPAGRALPLPLCRASAVPQCRVCVCRTAVPCMRVPHRSKIAVAPVRRKPLSAGALRFYCPTCFCISFHLKQLSFFSSDSSPQSFLQQLET